MRMRACKRFTRACKRFTCAHNGSAEQGAELPRALEISDFRCEGISIRPACRSATQSGAQVRVHGAVSDMWRAGRACREHVRLVPLPPRLRMLAIWHRREHADDQPAAPSESPPSAPPDRLAAPRPPAYSVASPCPLAPLQFSVTLVGLRSYNARSAARQHAPQPAQTALYGL